MVDHLGVLQDASSTPATPCDVISKTERSIIIQRPRLPIEVCENILDHIIPEKQILEMTTDNTALKTLVSCMKVCKDWYPCARKNLWREVRLNAGDVSSIYRKHKYLLPYLCELTVIWDSSYNPASSFFITHRPPNIHTLYLEEVNLSKEHKVFSRSPLFRPIRTLVIYFERECQLSHLIRLINAFPSLTSLTIVLQEALAHNGQVLPPVPKSTRSLSYLGLNLAPGLLRLIDWLIKAQLLTHLKTLFLVGDSRSDVTELRSDLEGVDRLTDNCGSSVEDLTLSFYNIPVYDDVEDPTPLKQFPKLRRLMYRADDSHIIRYAFKQLEAIPSMGSLVEVGLNVDANLDEDDDDDDDGESNITICRSIDILLSSGRFPSLSIVKLSRNIPFSYFPSLRSHRLLACLPQSQMGREPSMRKPGVLDELWELIIDWIYYEWTEAGWDWDTRRTLVSCSLVDRAWKRHAQLHLSKFREVYYNEHKLASLDHKDSALSSSIAGLGIIIRSETTPISSFPTQHQHRFPNLNHLTIEELNLTRKDLTPLFCSVRNLRLINIQPCKPSLLVRFLRSFSSLYYLELSFAHSKIVEQEDQIIHTPPFVSTTRSLKSFRLSLIPGISILLDELLQENLLFVHLKTLGLTVRGVSNEEELRSSFERVERLVDRCRTSVEDFRLYLDRVPIVHDCSDLVQLRSFRNLKHLTFGSPRGYTVLQHATRELKAISSRGSLVQVTFDAGRYAAGERLDGDACQTIDELLSGDRFPSLKSVFLHESIGFKHFPMLDRRSLLRPLSSSCWKREPRLPNGVCKLIIDWVYCGWVLAGWNRSFRRTLCMCSCVCWAWNHHAGRLLSKFVKVRQGYEEPSCISGLLDRNAGLSISFNIALVFKPKLGEMSVSSFAILYQPFLRHLIYLHIKDMDFTYEYGWPCRTTPFHSVQILKLSHLKCGKHSQLAHFLGSFPSLSRLELHFESPFVYLDLQDCIPSILSHIDIQSLTISLQLDISPGVSRLINWLLKANPRRAQIKTLILNIHDTLYADEFETDLQGVGRLLNCCRSSLEDLRIYLQARVKVRTARDLTSFVKLASFHNLKQLTYGYHVSRNTPDLIIYAAKQLGAISSTCHLTQITFDVAGTIHIYDLYCRLLDEILNEGRFPLLQAVILPTKGSFGYFPKLGEKRLLGTLAESFWGGN